MVLLREIEESSESLAVCGRNRLSRTRRDCGPR